MLISSLKRYLCIFQTFQGHESSVLRGDFLTEGQQLITAGGDGLLKLWTIKSGECVATFDQHEGRVWALTGKLSGGCGAVVFLDVAGRF